LHNFAGRNLNLVDSHSASLRCRSSRGVFPNSAPNAVEKCDPDENPHISPTCTIE
jgi:hypothetical protein